MPGRILSFFRMFRRARVAAIDAMHPELELHPKAKKRLNRLQGTKAMLWRAKNHKSELESRIVSLKRDIEHTTFSIEAAAEKRFAESVIENRRKRKEAFEKELEAMQEELHRVEDRILHLSKRFEADTKGYYTQLGRKPFRRKPEDKV